MFSVVTSIGSLKTALTFELLPPVAAPLPSVPTFEPLSPVCPPEGPQATRARTTTREQRSLKFIIPLA